MSFLQLQELGAIGSNEVKVAASWRAPDAEGVSLSIKRPSARLTSMSVFIGTFVARRTPLSLLSSHDISICANGHPILKLCVQQRHS